MVVGVSDKAVTFSRVLLGHDKHIKDHDACDSENVEAAPTTTIVAAGLTPTRMDPLLGLIVTWVDNVPARDSVVGRGVGRERGCKLGVAEGWPDGQLEGACDGKEEGATDG